jgi:cytochrome b pre-mRNA-processing protein 3
MFLSRLFRPSKLKTDAQAIYEAAVSQARTPAFYADHSVPDTVDGRFDMIVLHVWLVLAHLKQAPEAAQKQSGKLGQAIFDYMIIDFDRNVRQIGISDVRVGKHMKAMAKAFYGRLAAYDEAVEASILEDALKRNVYGKVETAEVVIDKQSKFLADYVQKQADYLGSQGFEALLDGKIAFLGEFSEESR